MSPIPEHITSPHDDGRGTDAVLALGSNLGDRERTMADAVRDIAEIDGLELTGVSAVFESAAVKLTGVDHDAPAYLNMVVAVRYDGEPEALLDAVNGIENEHGRVRTERWGDRTLDIDIVSFGDLVQNDGRLTLPHPRAAERDFVLAPWLQLDAYAVLTGRGKVAELLEQIENTVVLHSPPVTTPSPITLPTTQSGSDR